MVKLRHLKPRQAFATRARGRVARSGQQPSSKRVPPDGKYILAEMITLCDQKAARPAELATWDAALPVGHEVL